MSHAHPIKLTFDSQPDIMTEKDKDEIGELKPKGDSKIIEPTVGKYEIMKWIFTRSIEILSMPKTMEQNGEPIFIEVYSDSKDESPLHEP